ncbi:pseudouridine synthase [Agaribacterium sp. ZY112]|uniref:pseudouridine synthase n=1 Tax=Agaribacterium sp. ZY112 TaxID=3233574 RepID=UPI00352512B7
MLLHETEHFYLLNKPCGIAVNDEADSKGLVSLFCKQQGIEKAHPVHRLDKATSGLLLVAKTSQANSLLSQCFEKKTIEKRYLAIVHYKAGAKPKKKGGWVKGDMKPSRSGNWKLCPTMENPAQTQFVSWPLGERRRLCLLKPYTGKTHQLRVAMKALSSPIVGDERYGGQQADRLYLHAYSLEFELLGTPYYFHLWPNSGALFQTETVAAFNNKASLRAAL